MREEDGRCGSAELRVSNSHRKTHSSELQFTMVQSKSHTNNVCTTWRLPADVELMFSLLPCNNMVPDISLPSFLYLAPCYHIISLSLWLFSLPSPHQSPSSDIIDLPILSGHGYFL